MYVRPFTRTCTESPETHPTPAPVADQSVDRDLEPRRAGLGGLRDVQ